MKNTKILGEKTESLVLAGLLQVYPSVLIPFGDNQRYDFVFEDLSGNFKKVQCKTARYINGTISFHLTSSSSPNSTHLSYQGQIDYFGVNCPDFPEVYLVPIEETATRECKLRIDPPIIYNSKVRWAKDYLLWSPCSKY
jgi:hypothetical protein